MISNKSINEIANLVHTRSRAKGWYETPRQPLEFHMLMVSEIAEVSEEVRSKMPDVYFVRHRKDGSYEFRDYTGRPSMQTDIENGFIPKPEGEGIEIADLIIRALDYAAFKGWNIEDLIDLKLEYNETRAHRHGGKLL